MAAPQEALEALPGIGPEIAHDVVAFFARPRNKALIERLREAGLRLADEPPAESGPAPLDGLTFVITGTLPSQSREAAAALILANGGKVTGGISAKTSYLLTGDKPGAGKTSKAAKLGVPQLDEAGLMALISGETVATADADGPARAQLDMGL